MSEKILRLMLIYACFLVFHTYQVTVTEKNIPSPSTKTSTALRLKLNADERHHLSSSSCFVNSGIYKSLRIACSTNGPLLDSSYCATFSEDTKTLSIAECPYFQPNGYNITINGYILLPRNLSQLNDYMCGPLNRKGLVCSECADGFGPSVTSFGYRCVNCTDVWYGVPLFLILEFIPVTVLYLLILIFQISIISAPMPCFIMYAQLIAIVIDSDNSKPITKIILTDKWDFRLNMQIITTLYGLFNLDICNYVNIFIPHCLSDRLKFIHRAFLYYILAFYPILLIFLTWLCIELHGRNFRPLVWLWRPFHRCFVRLRRGWDTKSDIIDTFTTFFLLSYSKIMYQTLLLTISRVTINIDQFGRYIHTYQPLVDLSVNYGSLCHLTITIPVLLFSLVFNILPPIVLACYPFQVFRSCLSKCHLNFVAVNIFIDRVHSCYRNGLDGGRDMRSFSGLYFFLRFMFWLPSNLTRLLNTYSNTNTNRWFLSGILFCILSLSIAFFRPYNKPYMNYMDALLLLNIALLSFVLSTGWRMLLIARILLSMPVALLCLVICSKKFYGAIKFIVKACSLPSKLKYLLCRCFEGNASTTKIMDTVTETQPLIQPTSIVIGNSADDSEVTR